MSKGHHLEETEHYFPVAIISVPNFFVSKTNATLKVLLLN